jgi:hypothetical protein
VFSVWSMPRLHNKGQSAIGQDITCCISLHWQKTSVYLL